MKWISTPSISVVNCGNAFSLARVAQVVVIRPVTRELLDRRQLNTLRSIVDQLLWGRHVAVMRWRSSVSFSSGVSTRKERMSVAVWAVVLITASVASCCGSG